MNTKQPKANRRASRETPFTTWLNPEVCYRAVQSRDARFDGQFFTAIRTTGIYCRPICPAPTPKLQHVTLTVSYLANLWFAVRGPHESAALVGWTALGLRRAYDKLFVKVTAKQLAQIALAWQPWRAYAALYLWQEY